MISKYQHMFMKGAKLNMQVFSCLTIKNEDLQLLHLISSVVVSGQLKNTNLSNASFLSTKFSDVIFENCSLEKADICSIWAKDCKFINTQFDNSTISDSTFIDCVFDKDTFQGVTTTGCQFTDCVFEQFPIGDSTFSLNTFTHCIIKNSRFTESFYYQIFDSCIFQNINMPSELLGYNFGFSSQALDQLTQGKNLLKTREDFLNQKMYINAAILQINQIPKFYDEAVIACVAALGQMIQKDILIKADEIDFLRELTAYFLKHRQIAPFSILRIWELLKNSIVTNSPNTAISKAMPHIREFANMLYFDIIDFQNNLQQRINQIPKATDVSEMVELEIVYYQKPSSALEKYLTPLSLLVDDDCPPPRLLRTAEGSFIEYYEIALAVIPFLQTFLSLLGVMAPFVVYKMQKKEATQEMAGKKGKENTNIEIVISTQSVPSPILLPDNTSMRSTTSAMMIDVAKLLKKQPLKSDAGFSGYNSANIQSITIRFQ